MAHLLVPPFIIFVVIFTLIRIRIVLFASILVGKIIKKPGDDIAINNIYVR